MSLTRVTHSAAQIIGLALGIVEALLLVRIVLLFLAANPSATFSSLIYGWSAPLVAPFQGVFPNVVGNQGIVVDAAAILAMIVYAILARVVEAVIGLLSRL
ncbi:MAG: YggT family protein [Ktedonobacterales bacterium]